MKLLVDENLPPGLADDLTDLFPGSTHVRSVGLGSTADSIIWEYAKANGFTFITRDKDFANLSMTWGAPHKVILLQVGNCSTAGSPALPARTRSGSQNSKTMRNAAC